MNNSRNPKTLSFILEETLKDQRAIFFIDKCLSDTFKIHYNNILAGSNTVQGSNISIIQLYRESGIELLILNSPLIVNAQAFSSDQLLTIFLGGWSSPLLYCHLQGLGTTFNSNFPSPIPVPVA